MAIASGLFNIIQIGCSFIDSLRIAAQNPHRAHLKRGLRHKNLEPANLQPVQRVRTIIAVHYGAAQQRDVTIPAHVRNVDWHASKWVNQLAMDRFFQMDNGAVRVRKSGLYQVYAQVRTSFAL